MKTVSHTKLQELVNKWNTQPLYHTGDFRQAAGELQGLIDGDKPVEKAPEPGNPTAQPAPPVPQESKQAHEKEPESDRQPTHKETTRPERNQSDDAENIHAPKGGKVQAGTSTTDKVPHK